MTDEAGVGAAQAEADRAGIIAPAAHRHAWGRMAFELTDDRPVVREQCETCGIVRRFRAWERYWTPGEPEIRR